MMYAEATGDGVSPTPQGAAVWSLRHHASGLTPCHRRLEGAHLHRLQVQLRVLRRVAVVADQADHNRGGAGDREVRGGGHEGAVVTFVAGHQLHARERRLPRLQRARRGRARLAHLLHRHREGIVVRVEEAQLRPARDRDRLGALVRDHQDSEPGACWSVRSALIFPLMLPALLAFCACVPVGVAFDAVVVAAALVFVAAPVAPELPQPASTTAAVATRSDRTEDRLNPSHAHLPVPEVSPM